MSENNIQQPEFMPEVEKLQGEISSLKERLDLVENNREKVRPKIYEKVKGEYEEKLTVLFDQLNPFKEKIDSEIESLQNEIAEFQEEAEGCEEETEEFQLRFFAGEFSEDDFEPKQKELQDRLDTLKLNIEEKKDAIKNLKVTLSFITGEPLEEEEEEEEELEEAVEDEDIPEEDLEAPVEDEYPEADEDIAEADEDIAEADEDIADADEDIAEVDEDIADADEDIAESYEDDEVYEDSEDEYSAEEDEGEESDTGMEDYPDTQMKDMEDLDAPVEEVGEEGDDYVWTSTPVLDVIEGDFTGESYHMDKDRITVGRGPNNDIQLATDTSVSRHHAQLTQEGSHYILVDLESSNGSSVNGIRITRVSLRPNDEIMIGQSKLIIRPSQD